MSITATPFVLRSMTPADIPQVVAIERSSFPTNWPASAYRRELQQNQLARYIVAVERPPAQTTQRAQRGPRLLGLPAALRRRLRPTPEEAPPSPERIVGFLGLWFMVDEGHIVTVAVDPASRRRGVGELLVAQALEMARAGGAQVVTLECRVSNIPAQALYEKYGFTRAGIRKRYYTDNGEDALIMTTPRLDDPAYSQRLADLRRRAGLRTED